jgi:hypothetical protein
MVRHRSWGSKGFEKMRYCSWLVLAFVSHIAFAETHSPSNESVQRFRAQLQPICLQLRNEMPSLALLSNTQARNHCQCAVSRTTSYVLVNRIQDGDQISEQLLLDFLSCGRSSILKASSLDLQKRGLKLNGQTFEINAKSGHCVANLEYNAYIQSLTAKTQPNREEWEKKMAYCIQAK